MIQAVTRLVLVGTGILSGYAAARVLDWQAEVGLSSSYIFFMFIILGASIGFLFGGIIGRELQVVWGRVETEIAEMSATDFVLVAAGLVFGLVVAFLFGQPLRLLQPTWLAVALSILLSVVASYIGIQLALTRRHELVRVFPRLAQSEDAAPGEKILILDTSAVIDGRFVGIRDAGCMPGVIRVPRFVLAELQTLADSADDHRRAMGRRGLDLLDSLPSGKAVETFEVDYAETPGVDDKLMRLASDSGSVLVTVDYNLTKVARVRGIETLNLNEVAEALRPAFLPGDGLRLNIVKRGKESGQGVGYLEDGTMVVVDHGESLVGSQADVEVTSVLQTGAGRMMFAQVATPETRG